jgi:hypothetical protein
MVATLTGCRYIGSRERPRDSRGHLHFQAAAKSRAAFTVRSPYLFRDTMLKLIHSDNLEYKELTKAA